jgi:hypothetical protein
MLRTSTHYYDKYSDYIAPYTDLEYIKNMSMADWAKVRRSYADVYSTDREKEILSNSRNNDTVNETFNFLSGGIKSSYSVPEIILETNDATTVDWNEVRQIAAQNIMDNYYAKYTKEKAYQYSSIEKPAKIITYDDLYWRFVNATDPFVAADSLALMLDKVTIDMEPASDYSWVSEIETSKVIVKTKKSAISRFITIFNITIIVGAIVIIALEMLGIIK